MSIDPQGLADAGCAGQSIPRHDARALLDVEHGARDDASVREVSDGRADLRNAFSICGFAP